MNPPSRPPLTPRVLAAAALLALVGVVWLAAVTELSVLRAHWPALLALLALHTVFAQIDFADLLDRETAASRGTQARLITWSAALIFGPTAVWLDVIGALGYGIWTGRPASAQRRHAVGQVATAVARHTLSALVALTLYRLWGGGFPLADLRPATIGAALAATAVKIALSLALTAPLYWAQRAPDATRTTVTARALVPLIDFLAFWRSPLLFYLLPAPLGVLAAGLFAEHGWWAYLFFVLGIGLLLVPAYRLGQRAVRDQQAAYRMARLEELARALLYEPPHAIDLPAILGRFLPPIARPDDIEVRLFLEHVLYPLPLEQPLASDAFWQQLQTVDDDLLLQRDGANGQLLGVPIVDAAGGERIGGIVLRPANPDGVSDRLPVLHALAAQIAGALQQVNLIEQLLKAQAEAYREEVYSQAYEAEVALAYQRVAQELTLAGRIQTSFLPRALPVLPGWQISVTLEPARETSGDFYDFIQLPDDRLGLLVADVADKGMGAALFMALSRTLIRTYAVEHGEPARVLAAANRRILADTSTDLFVTVFYGVLDPRAGTLTYCNAGHNPPFLLHQGDRSTVHTLTRTALPLGILEDVAWGEAVIDIAPGAVLTVYTDGITEAQDDSAELFGEQRLFDTVRANLGRSAAIIDAKILDAIDDFVGEMQQFDDITLMVVVREP